MKGRGVIINLLVRTMGQLVLPTQVFPLLFDMYCNPHPSETAPHILS